MDPHTLEKLDFDAVRRLLAEHVNCALGRALALKITPSSRPDLVAQWHTQVREMIEVSSRQDLPPFGGVHDIREAVRVAVPPHCLEPDDLAVVAETLTATHAIVGWIERLPEHVTILKGLCAQIGDFHPLAEAIRRVIGMNGEIRDDASAKLLRIRTEISQARINVGHAIDRLLRDRQLTRWLRYPQATFHDDRLVLPLAAEHRGRIPGIVHRSSDSGATIFVEPAAAVELNNRIITLKQDEHAEVSRLLLQLVHQIYLNQAEIIKTMDALAVLDLISAKARFARSYDLHCPRISQDGKLLLRQARHPMLIQMQKEAAQRSETTLRSQEPYGTSGSPTKSDTCGTGGSPAKSDTCGTGVPPVRSQPSGSGPKHVVPIDVRLSDDFDLLVITGPNTGGKTVTLKTVGLACLMAQAGLPIAAAEGSAVPIYQDILIDIGDEQSLQQSLSTFSAHLSWLLVMLKRAQPNTLVLIDELGAGTDPDEGAALGRAIVEELLRQRCSTIVTTHLGVLKSVAFGEARAENACVDFDPKTLQPTYRLLIGEPGNSNAINIATRLGIPDRIIKAARGHLSESSQQLDRAIKGTLQSRRQAERARAEAETAKLEADQQKEAARQETLTLQQKQVDFDRWVQRMASLRAGDRVHVKRFDREGTIVRVLLHKQIAVVDVGAMEMEIPLRELGPAKS